MSIKKTLLLAGMALAVVSALVASPAMAEEFELSNWTMEGKAESKERAVAFEGQVKFSLLGGGIECKVHKTKTTNIGNKTSSTGTVHIKITRTTCKGSGFLFSGCEVESVEETNEAETLTRDYHVTKTKPSGKRETVTTKPRTRFKMKNCAAAELIEFEAPAAVGTPDNASAIKSVSLAAEEGKAYLDDPEHESPVEMEETATLNVVGEIEGKPAAGTFGIE